MKLTYREQPSGLEKINPSFSPIVSSWDKTFCCEVMKSAWNDKRIGLDETGIVVNMEESVSLFFTDCYEGDVEHISVPIHYCPFCGARIIKIDNQVKV